MCGIFGIVVKKGATVDFQDTDNIISTLFCLSESRGKESAGIAVKSSAGKRIAVYKTPMPASKLIKTCEYRQFIQNELKSSFTGNENVHPFAVIAHARLVTNGTQAVNSNNQPVIKDNAVVIHNGIIVNAAELWRKYDNLHREFEVDTEIFPALFRHFRDQGFSAICSKIKTFNEIYGAAAIALLQNDSDEVIISTNNASLYWMTNKKRSILIFASERYILSSLCRKLRFFQKDPFGIPKRISPGCGCLTGLFSDEINEFTFRDIDCTSPLHISEPKVMKDPIVDLSSEKSPINEPSVTDPGKESHYRQLLEFNIERINGLKRCSRCVLPETFPFIDFDQEGVCNYCRSYIRKVNLGVSKSNEKRTRLENIVERYRKKNDYDVIVPFSGGRDSSYGLHFIKKELGLNPITFTYDWGMVTDLARRNISRLTGKLGIENILISADIRKNRENIRKNVSAWMKRPELGIIPLFMAGDKQFFYFANEIKRQTGIRLDIWMGNRLENTDFKVGFCGIPPDFEKTRIDYLPVKKRIRLLNYYAGCFLQNPSYLNSSLKDTFLAYWYYYYEPRKDYYLLFDYIPWDETTVEKTIRDEYDWELSRDTPSTWRIGDGTAGFYNYIYYTVTGFSEIDTFRSNQVREGMLSREKALQLVNEENKPRYDSIKWYCDTINIGFEDSIRTINGIKKLY